jgi:hypothetical protein
MNLEINIDCYEIPEWMAWENMPDYEVSVPLERTKSKGWKIQNVCLFCGEPIKDGFVFCGLHTNLFRKREVKIVRR